MKKIYEAGQAISRRSFVSAGVAALGGILLAGAPNADAQASARNGVVKHAGTASRSSSFLEILRAPDQVSLYASFAKTLPSGSIPLERKGDDWVSTQAQVECRLQNDSLAIELAAPGTEVSAVHLRWQVRVTPTLLVLGDAWERSYGELGWRNLIPERVLPWYFATSDGSACHGYGVTTDARALCFWQVDQQGVSLWLNVCNGGQGVVLGQRRLTMASVVSRQGRPGDEAIDAVTALCRQMCARTSRPLQPIYGSNDWNYSYGHSTAESILRDAEFVAKLSPVGRARPFCVIDEGYKNGSEAWPDMRKLADAIKQQTVRPGIWIRPLRVPKGTAAALLMPDARFGDRKERAAELAYDPTVPEAQEKIRDKVREVVGWGYEMVKHDFSTYDLLGRWGFEMGPQPTLPGWSLHDRSRTNAEVIADLYALIRETAGAHTLIDGCNTIGHLGQGLWDAQRTGDDTSGRNWERTRRMGVNTAAFRLPQHGTFFCVDADIIGITESVPWELNRQWLDMLARSGTSTIIAPGPPARGQEQQAAIRDAFEIAAAGGAGARPVDWMETSAPARWRGRSGDLERFYDWNGAEGASPFEGG